MVSRTRVQNIFTVKVADFVNETFVERIYKVTASKNLDTVEKLAREIKRVYKDDVNPASIKNIQTVYTLYSMDDETFFENAKVEKTLTVDGYGFTTVPADFRKDNE